MKKNIILILIIIMLLGVVIYFYFDNNKTQENANKVQAILKEKMSIEFYKKTSNKFCTNAKNELEQMNVAEDMM